MKVTHGLPNPFIGHEIAGEVVEIGDGVENFTLNDRISTGADVPCGECDYCRAGLANSCKINYAIGYQFDGGFANISGLITGLSNTARFGLSIRHWTGNLRPCRAPRLLHQRF